MLKRMRMDTSAPISSVATTSAQNGNVKYSEKGKLKNIIIEDVDEDATEEPSDFAPGGDADYFAEEDEEGRFFGGGLTDEQKKIFNIFDNVPEDGNLPDGVRVSFLIY